MASLNSRPSMVDTIMVHYANIKSAFNYSIDLLNNQCFYYRTLKPYPSPNRQRRSTDRSAKGQIIFGLHRFWKVVLFDGRLRSI